MKNILKNSALFVIFVFFIGCNNSKNNKSTENHSDIEKLQNEDISIMNLNDGNKWLVNEEMKPYVEDAKTLLIDFKKNKSENYKELATALKNKNLQLIKSCTMKGQSHDELHKWLFPHIEKINELATANNTTEALKIIHQLENSFNIYDQYFQ